MRLTDDVGRLLHRHMLALYTSRVELGAGPVDCALRAWLISQRIRDDADYERIKNRMCDLFEVGLECSDDEVDERDWCALLLDEYEQRKGW